MFRMTSGLSSFFLRMKLLVMGGSRGTPADAHCCSDKDEATEAPGVSYYWSAWANVRSYHWRPDCWAGQRIREQNLLRGTHAPAGHQPCLSCTRLDQRNQE